MKLGFAGQGPRRRRAADARRAALAVGPAPALVDRGSPRPVRPPRADRRRHVPHDGVAGPYATHPEAVVVLHVGGAAGGFDAALERFERGAERLSERARDRLVIENDDRTFALCHVMGLHERTGLKVVWDILHHHCNDPDGLSDREALALALALSTWPTGVRPKIHYSTPKTAMEEKREKVGRKTEIRYVMPQLRAHADVIDPIGFEHFLRETAEGLDFDVMLEAKAKDLALLRLREQMLGRGYDLTPGSTAPRPARAAA